MVNSHVLWEAVKIVIKEQLKQQNPRKIFKGVLLMAIRPQFNDGGVIYAASIVHVLFKFLKQFLWFWRFQWFRAGDGFVSVFSMP